MPRSLQFSTIVNDLGTLIDNSCMSVDD